LRAGASGMEERIEQPIEGYRERLELGDANTVVAPTRRALRRFQVRRAGPNHQAEEGGKKAAERSQTWQSYPIGSPRLLNVRD